MGRAGPVQGRGLLQFAGYALEPGKEQDYPKADVLPGDHYEKRIKHDVEVGKPGLHEAS